MLTALSAHRRRTRGLDRGDRSELGSRGGRGLVRPGRRSGSAPKGFRFRCRAGMRQPMRRFRCRWTFCWRGLRWGRMLSPRHRRPRRCTRSAPPFLVVAGEEDRLVPIAQSEALVARLRAAGVRGRVPQGSRGRPRLHRCRPRARSCSEAMPVAAPAAGLTGDRRSQVERSSREMSSAVARRRFEQRTAQRGEVVSR